MLASASLWPSVGSVGDVSVCCGYLRGNNQRQVVPRTQELSAGLSLCDFGLLPSGFLVLSSKT